MFRHGLLVLVSLCFLATLSYSEERANVPDKYKWNTADIYPSVEAWKKAKDDVAGRIPKIAEFQGKLGESAGQFFNALSSLMDLNRDLDWLVSYASMCSDEDTRVNSNMEMKQSIEELFVTFSTAASFVRPEILSLGAAKINDFLAADKRLAPYEPWLADILRYEAHTLSPSEEKIAAQADIMAQSGSSIFNLFKNAELPFPEVTLSTGEKIRLDVQAYTQYRASANRADRDIVFKTFWSKFKEFERTFGATLSAQIKSHMFYKDVHKFDSCLSAALFDANIPARIYTQLIADVHANLPTLHRYLRLRQHLMGVDQLRYEDLYAPIIKEVALRFTPEEACDLVVKAAEPLGGEYTKALEKCFSDRWVDYMPSAGKQSGAYSTGVYGVHPYQLLNFTGLYSDVSTLAHECGHSMHSFLSSQHQPYATHDYKTFVAEVASTLNENLLFHYMLSQYTDKDTRIFLLGCHLEGLRTTLFRQGLFAEFELRMHDVQEKGESLTGEKLSALYLGLLKEYYGDAANICKVDDLYGVEWAFIPHFYGDFYVYQYATSVVASSQIAANIRAEASAPGSERNNLNAYLNMLSSGSSKYPIELLKNAGADMSTSAPFNATMMEMNSIMDEIESLIGLANK